MTDPRPIRIPSTVTPGRHLTIRAAVDRMTNLPRPGEVALHIEDADNGVTCYVPVGELRAALDEIAPRPDGNTVACCSPVGLRATSRWLVEVHDHCTCGGSGVLSLAHQPGCGLVPLVPLADIEGLATLPAPVVSGEAVVEMLTEDANAYVCTTSGLSRMERAMVTGYVREVLRGEATKVAALGLTVADEAVEDRQPYEGPQMDLILAGHDMSLAPHYRGPGKWCEACPIPEPIPDACPTCGSTVRLVLGEACGRDQYDPDDWHRTHPTTVADEGRAGA